MLKKTVPALIVALAAFGGVQLAHAQKNYTEGGDTYTGNAHTKNKVQSGAAKQGKFDTYTDGAKQGKFDTYTDGANKSTKAELNPAGTTAKTGKADPYTDGAKAGKFDTFSDGARAGKFDPYSEGAKSDKPKD